MRQFGTAALAKDRHVIGESGEALRWKCKSEPLGRGCDRLPGRDGPSLCCRNVAGDELVAHLGIQIGPKQVFLPDRFLLSLSQHDWVARIQRMPEFLEARSQDFS